MFIICEVTMDYPQSITIRPMAIEDYDQVYGLWISTPGMGLNSIDDSRDGIGKYLERNPGTSFVAMDGGELVGVILCGHDGRRGVIHHTAVKAQLQGQGIGKALFEAAVDVLKQQGITKAWLVVKRYNERGNAFWARLGFQERTDLCFHGITLNHAIESIDT